MAPDCPRKSLRLSTQYTKTEELKKGLHGKTQNQNESCNALIWQRNSKSIYISIEKMRLAIYDAVAVFINRRQGPLKVLKNVEAWLLYNRVMLYIERETKNAGITHKWAD